MPQTAQPKLAARALPRWEGAATAAALALVALLALVQRFEGLNPGALFLDDQWVAVLVQHATLGDLLAIHPPAPLGFVLILKACAALLGRGAWQLQLFPLLCAIVQIPLLGMAAYRWSGRLWTGLAAALLLALNSTLGIYSLRVKAFSADSLATVALLALAVECLRRKDNRWLAALALAALLASLVSFPSIFVSLVLVNLLAWRMPSNLASNTQRRAAGLIAGGFDAAIALLYLLLLREQSNAALAGYWSDHYLPLSAQAGEFLLRGGGAEFFRGAFPDQAGWLTLLLLPGLLFAALRAEYRPLGLAMALILLITLAASALRLYPIGEGRLDLFANPILILLAALGLTPPFQSLRLVPRLASFALAALFAMDLLTINYGYPSIADRQMVELAAAAGEEDGLVVYPWANYAVGLYGPWQVDLVKVSDSTNRFYVHPRRANTLVLHESHAGVDFRQRPEVVTEQLRPFLRQDFRRLFYVSGTTLQQPHDWIVGFILAQGYVVVRSEANENATFILFEKPKVPTGPQARESGVGFRAPGLGLSG